MSSGKILVGTVDDGDRYADSAGHPANLELSAPRVPGLVVTLAHHGDGGRLRP